MPQTLPEYHGISLQNLVPIGSVVFESVEEKCTDKHSFLFI